MGLLPVVAWLLAPPATKGGVAPDPVPLGRGMIERIEGGWVVKGGPFLVATAPSENFRLTVNVKVLTKGPRPEIWISPLVRDLHNRWAVALRGGLMPDIMAFRFGEWGGDRLLGMEVLPLRIAPGRRYRLKIEVEGKRLSVWLGERKWPVIDVYDPEPPKGRGIAIGGGTSRVAFTDLEVRPLPARPKVEPLKFSPRAVKVNFGLESPEGWLCSDGSPYSRKRGFGWDKDMRHLARKRGVLSDILKDTLIAVAHGTMRATFMLDLPNGEYVLTIVGGDPSFPSHLEYYAEGVKAPLVRLDLPAGAFETLLRPVHIEDGRLDLTVVSNHPLGQPGGAICALVVERREDAPEKFAAARAEWLEWRERWRREVWRERMAERERRLRREWQRKLYKPARFRLERDNLRKPRLLLPLSGRWLFLPSDEVDPSGPRPFEPRCDDRSWHVMGVPATWDPVQWWLFGGHIWGRRAVNGASSNWAKLELLRVEGLTFDWRKVLTAWYRHKFALPASLKGRHVRLRFWGVASVCEVWLNGRRVGGHVGMFAPFEFDITPFINFGSENVLAVLVSKGAYRGPDPARILGPKLADKLTQSWLDRLPHGMLGRQGGIWGPVELILTNPARVEGVFFKPRLDGGEVEIEVANWGGKALSPRVEVSFLDRGSGTLLARRAVEVGPLPSGARRSLSVDFSGLRPKLWWPERPHLYVLRVSLLDEKGRPLDEWSDEVGFRTFEVKGARFYLNGKPYFLRGANHAPCGLKPWDRRLAHRFLRLMHEGNELVTRTHASPFTEAWLDAADEEGVGVSLEGVWPWVMVGRSPIPQRELLDVWREEQTALVKAYRNHPSLLMWTVNNECTPFDGDRGRMLEKWRILSGIIRAIRALDPTRPVVADSRYVRNPRFFEEVLRPAGIDDGDIDDAHVYYGWYSRSPFHLYGKEIANFSGERPGISQECSTGYPNVDTGHPARVYITDHLVPQAWVGDWAYEDRDPEVFLRSHAWTTKELAEAIRRYRRKTCGVLLFANCCWFRNCFDAERIEPYPTYFAVKTAFQPILVSWEQRNRHLFSGTTIRPRVCVVHDDLFRPVLKAPVLKWRLLDKSGEALAEGEKPLPDVRYYSNHWTEVEMRIPAVEGRKDLRAVLELESEGKILSRNEYPLTVASREWASGRGRLFVLSAGEALPRALEWLGFEVVRLERMPQKSLPGPLVVEGSWLAKEAALRGKMLSSFVKSGGVAILLGAGPEAVGALPEVLSRAVVHNFEVANMWEPTSPVFSGLEPLDLRWWGVDGDKVPYVAGAAFWPKEGEDVEVLATAIREHGYLRSSRDVRNLGGAVLLLIRMGRGRLVISAFRWDAVVLDPLAARLTANLLAWIARFSS